MASGNDEFEQIARQFGDVPLLGRPKQQMPPTSTIKTLRSTSIDIAAVVDEEDVVRGLQLTLEDHSEVMTYIFRFNEEVRAFLLQRLNEIPAVGEKIPDDAE